jgi:carboxyl-terminal processing protease
LIRLRRASVLRASIIGAICLSVIQSVPGQNSDANPEFQQTWKLLNVINSEIQQQHITPPATQQVYLSAIEGIYSASGILIPRRFSKAISCLSDESDFKKLAEEAWLDAKRSEHFDAQRSSRSAINYAIWNVAPGANFISADENRVQQQLGENQYVGIGVTVHQSPDGLVIQESHIGGPANKAGLRSGDIVVEIDGRPTAGKAFRDIIDELRGPKGSDVTVVVRNENKTQLRTVSMTRNVVPLATVAGTRQNEDGRWILAYRPGIAMLTFNSIVGSTAAEFNQLARQVSREGFKGLILDFSNVRNDVQLHHAVMLADALVGRAELAELQSVEGSTIINTRSEHSLPEIPLVVIARGDVSGPLFMVLSAIKNHTNARFAGDQVSSDLVCRRSVELPDDAGVISGLPYAFCKPIAGAAAGAQNKHALAIAPDIDGDEFLIRGKYLIEPDIESDPERMMEEIVRILTGN